MCLCASNLEEPVKTTVSVTLFPHYMFINIYYIYVCEIGKM